ncbi:MAG: hypothetical protein U9O54_05380 [Chloroflexota bacterium]|nr:hypothetical protein [Chloroflexota bacterium]
MKKLLLLFLIPLVLLAACSSADSEPAYEPPILSAVPTRAATSTPLPDDVQVRAREELSWALDTTVFVEQEIPNSGGKTVFFYQLSGLSTGETYTVEIDNYQLDVLDIYLMMIPGPISVPLVIGVEDEQGYTSLVIPLRELSRDELIETIAKLPRWQEVTAVLMGGVVTSEGVDWEACQETNPYTHCRVGQLLENKYPYEMRLLRIQALDRVPNGFVLPWSLILPTESEPISQPTLSPSEIDNLVIPTPGE